MDSSSISVSVASCLPHSLRCVASAICSHTSSSEIEAKIIELDKNRNNVVLSRRAWLEQTSRRFATTSTSCKGPGPGSGVVSSIVNFGAFVDLGGVDGLVHVSELS